MRDLANHCLGLRRVALRQHKQCAALQLLRLVAAQDLLEDWHCLRLVLLHEGIQRQQFEVLVRLSLWRYRMAALAADFNLKSTTFVQPPALCIILPQFAAGVQRIGRLSFFGFGEAFQ